MGSKLVQHVYHSNSRKRNHSYCNAFVAPTEGKGTIVIAMHLPLQLKKREPKLLWCICHFNWRKGNQSYCDTFATLAEGKGTKVIETHLPL